MAGTGAGYDLDVNVYSPDGRIFQVEYAQKAVDNAPTSLAFVCKDGIIFGTEKILLNRMLIQGTNRRAYAISKTAGCCIGGVGPDGRLLLEKARDEATNYLSTYGEEIPAHILTERVGSELYIHTLFGGYRPVGATILIGKYDKDVPSIFCVDPSGMVTKWKGKAVGKGRQLANTEIEKLDLDNLTCREALFHVARILNKVHDEQKPFELEINWICKETGYTHAVVAPELIKEAEEQAKKALEDEDED